MPRSRRGIRSREDFGSALRAASGLYLLTSAIGSSAFVNGPTLVKKLQLVLSVGALPGASALGSPNLVPGGRSALPTGIVSAEVVATPRALARQTASPSSIATAQAVNSPLLRPQQFALPSSISSAGALGSTTLIRQPVLTSANHAVMDPLGGQSLVLTGLYLSGVTSVLIGGTSCSFSANTSTSVTVTTPAKTYGNYSIVVVTAGGTSNQLSIESWDPAQSGAITAFWDSRTGLSLTGANVNSWTDRVGGVVASAAGGARPQRVANALGTAQGITFDGVDDGLTLPTNKSTDPGNTGVDFFLWIGKWPTYGWANGSASGDGTGEPILGDPLGATSAIGMDPASNGVMLVERGQTDGGANWVGSGAETSGATTANIVSDDTQVNVVAVGQTSSPAEATAWANGTFSSAVSGYFDVRPGAIGRGTSSFFKGTLGAVLLGDSQSYFTAGNLNKIRDWAQITFGAA